MRYVILRDDDTNALTPVECLERLYRPFLERKLPVNLAVIPGVRTDTLDTKGMREGYLFDHNGPRPAGMLSIADNRKLVGYLKDNPGYHVVQHGYQHSLFEFDSANPDDMAQRLDRGAELLREAGFDGIKTFVAPYDRLSRESLQAVTRRFQVLSTGWFERRRLPVSWRPKYIVGKLRRHAHWRKGDTMMLTHPGCLLSYHRPMDTMLEEVRSAVASRQLTVLVTHWWEYFYGGKENAKFISNLHQVADLLANDPEVEVISFNDLVERKLRLN